jgi:COMPASS component SWD2
MVRRLRGHVALGRTSGEEVSWSGDSKFVISGSGDGSICIWDLTPVDISPVDGKLILAGPTLIPGLNPRCITLDPVVRLQSGGVEGVASRCVRFNPRLGMLASGGEDLVSLFPIGESRMRLMVDVLVTRERRECAVGRGLLR